MLVVDLHTLQAVDFLHLVDDVFLHLHRALNGEDVGGSDSTVGERRTGFDIVAVLSQNLLRGGDEVGALLAGLRGDGHLAVAALEFLGDGDDTVDFGHDGGVGRVAGLEEFGDAGQTARDIASLTEGTRYLDHDITGMEFLTLVDTDMGTDGKVVHLEDVAFGIHDIEGRVLGTLTALDDDLVLQAGLSVALDTVGDVLDNILEGDATGDVGNNNGIVRIPLGNKFVLGQHVAGSLVKLGAVGQQGREEGNVGIGIDNTHFSRTTHDNMVAVALVVGIRHGTEFVDDETAFVFGLQAGGGTNVSTGDTTDVEGSQGQLSTRLTDSLCGDDADGLTLLDHLAGGQVAAIALGADAMLRLASEDGTDFDLLDGRLFNLLADFLGEFFTGMGDKFAGLRVVDVVYRSTTEYLLAQRLNNILAFLEGSGGQTTECRSLPH